MNITPIVNVVLTVVGVGAVLGAGLATAAQVFAVKENPTTSAIEEVLPGINCGACGYPGCSGYAEAVATDPEVPANLCIPGGSKTSDKIAEITGKSAGSATKKISVLRCTQDARLGPPPKYKYEGIMDCAAIDVLQKGVYTCPYACVGLGNCARICPVNAIEIVNRRPVVDADLCTGCGLCVKTCPRDVFELAIYPGRVQVYCRNTLPPKEKRTLCPSACIGCSLCKRNCPYDAIKIENFIAIVDHNKCPKDCPMPCLDKCPTGAILARGIDAQEKNAPLMKKFEHLLNKNNTQNKEG